MTKEFPEKCTKHSFCSKKIKIVIDFERQNDFAVKLPTIDLLNDRTIIFEVTFDPYDPGQLVFK